jgi:hypothetical protein
MRFGPCGPLASAHSTTLHFHAIAPAQFGGPDKEMLRISLSGPPNRRQQPERYVQCALKLIGRNKKY